MNSFTLTGRVVAAQQQARVLQANVDQASANVIGLEKQVEFHQQRLADIAQLTKSGAGTPFREQDTLARVRSLGGTSAYPAVISVPQNTDRSILRLGTSGTATVFSETAGVIGLIARILLWIQSYEASARRFNNDEQCCF